MPIFNINLVFNWIFVFKLYLCLNVAFLCLLSLTILLQHPVTAVWLTYLFYNREIITPKLLFFKHLGNCLCLNLTQVLCV
jgi:hypothetical protein